MSELLRIDGKVADLKEFPVEGIDLRPLTVFIGRQGTGKSLISQFAYFYQNLPYLVGYEKALPDQTLKTSEDFVRKILDDLRSKQRAIAVFGSPSASIKWRLDNGPEYSFHVESRTSQITINAELEQYVKDLASGKQPFPIFGNAVYIPAERVIYSHASGPSFWRFLSLPSTLSLFADLIGEATKTYEAWGKGIPDTEEGKFIHGLGRSALRGELYRRGEKWKWKLSETSQSSKQIDIDMASSGQKANWPVLLMAEVVFNWRQQGLIANPFHIHIEEPEIHLHPDAQVAMFKILAYLARHGFHVLITTHSLTILDTLNNLLTAGSLKNRKHPGLPDEEIFLTRDLVSAYIFTEKGRVESILKDVNLSPDPDVGVNVPWVDEDRLREVDANLSRELNRIRYFLANEQMGRASNAEK